ncbi:MAG: acyltransferase family protein, partial [Alphaproteobacteria bacterium]
VISGYLISSIILNDLKTGNFSFVNFYARRIIRIFPALILVLICSLVCGWIILFKDEYLNLLKHAISSTNFTTNLSLLKESGYFDKSSQTKPLLHLWSLAIEEQFYILWPLTLVLLWNKKIKFIIVALTIISFFCNFILIFDNPSKSFYLLQFRAWELLCGCYLATINLKNFKYQNLYSIIGVGLIGLAISTVQKDNHIVFLTLITIIGSCLIIVAQKSWLNQKFIANKVLVGIGLISYSLYLWHWPIISFMKIYFVDDSFFLKFLAIAISIILSTLTYFLIEKPIRKPNHLTLKSILLLVIFILTGLSVLFIKNNLHIIKNLERDEYLNFFDNSIPQMQYTTNNDLLNNYRMDCDFYNIDKYRKGKATIIPVKKIPNSCYQNDKRFSKKILLWGDSHSQHLYYGLKNNLPKNWQILIVASSACHPKILNSGSKTNYCEQSNWFAVNTIKNIKPDVVLITQKSTLNIENINEIIFYLKKLGIKKIIFVGQVPIWDVLLPRLIAQKFWKDIPKRTFKGINRQIIIKNSLLRENFAEQEGAVFVDLIKFLCNDDGCLVRFGNDIKNDIVSWDYGHFTLNGSDFIAKNLLVDAIVK